MYNMKKMNHNFYSKGTRHLRFRKVCHNHLFLYLILERKLFLIILTDKGKKVFFSGREKVEFKIHQMCEL